MLSLLRVSLSGLGGAGYDHGYDYMRQKSAGIVALYIESTTLGGKHSSLREVAMEFPQEPPRPARASSAGLGINQSVWNCQNCWYHLYKVPWTSPVISDEAKPN